MKLKLIGLVLGLLSSAPVIVDARLECTTTTSTSTRTRPADFLFLVDTSGSMQSKINGMIKGLQKFIRKMDEAKLNSRYALVTFGGDEGSKPLLRMPFSSTANDIIIAMSRITAGGGGREASFEAMRLVLQNPKKLIKNRCLKKNCGDLEWRSDATKVFIHATDEDSDMPIYPEFLATGQNTAAAFCVNYYSSSRLSTSNPQDTCAKGTSNKFEPSFSPSVYWRSGNNINVFRSGPNLRLTAPFQAEVDLTADILHKAGVYLNSLVSGKVGTSDGWPQMPFSAWSSKNPYFNHLARTDRRLVPDVMTAAFAQFGHPDAAVQNADYTGFNRDQTIQKLRQFGAGQSLQAQMLSKGGFMRLFEIAAFDDGKSVIIDNFYSHVVDTVTEVSKKCIVVPDALPSLVQTVPSPTDNDFEEDQDDDSSSSLVVVPVTSSSIRPSSSSIRPSSSPAAPSSSSIRPSSSPAAPSSSSIRPSSSPAAPSSSPVPSSSPAAPSSSPAVIVPSSSIMTTTTSDEVVPSSSTTTTTSSPEISSSSSTSSTTTTTTTSSEVVVLSSSEIPSSSEAPIEPTSSEAPVPSSSEAPVIPSSSEAPVIPSSSEAPVVPTSSEAPVVPTSSEAPVIPTSSEAPVIPSSSEAPVIPSSSEAPVIPSSSEAPVIPSSSEAPVIPSSSEAPVIPSSSEAPVPSSSEAPIEPTSSEAPVPSSSEAPVVPSSSEAPVVPTSSEAPIVPTSSEAEIEPSPTTTSTEEVIEETTTTTEEVVEETATSTSEVIEESATTTSESEVVPTETETSDDGWVDDWVDWVEDDDSNTNNPSGPNDQPTTNDEDEVIDDFIIPDVLPESPEEIVSSAESIPVSTQAQQIQSIEQPQQQIVIKNDSQSSIATYTVLVPAFVASAGLGLFMLRRSRSIARDIKFAFGPAEQAGGNNPLYESLVRTEDNPLFVDPRSIESQQLGVRNIEDAA